MNQSIVSKFAVVFLFSYSNFFRGLMPNFCDNKEKNGTYFLSIVESKIFCRSYVKRNGILLP